MQLPAGTDRPPAAAQNADQSLPLLLPDGRYRIAGDLREPEDISGIAMFSPFHGLIGADEESAVQVFEIATGRRRLRVIDTIHLLKADAELDIEAIAVDQTGCYVAGSHGLSKKEGEFEESRYALFRLSLSDLRSRFGPKGHGRKVPVRIERTSLAGIFRQDEVLRSYFARPLQERGLNIEGLAARRGKLMVGLRNPNIDGNAFVLEVAAEDLFSGQPAPPYVLHALSVGQGLGVREIIATREQYLLIAGNAGAEPSERFPVSQDYAEDRPFIIFRWSGGASAPLPLGRLSEPPGKAEALLLLAETDFHWQVLVLFDGPKGGKSTIYRIAK